MRRTKTLKSKLVLILDLFNHALNNPALESRNGIIDIHTSEEMENMTLPSQNVILYEFYQWSIFQYIKHLHLYIVICNIKLSLTFVYLSSGLHSHLQTYWVTDFTLESVS